ncbi:hypothetical protein PG984_008398 [Apiospora sp. TS-2023a]
MATGVPSVSLAQLPDESEANFSPTNEAGDATCSSYEIFQGVLDQFKAELPIEHVDSFSTTTLEKVKRKILSIQQSQEQQKRLMGLSRMATFISKIGEFDGFCMQAKVWGEESSLLSAWIWGPAMYILETSAAHNKAFDNIISSYLKFGGYVPNITFDQDLLSERPQISDCLAYMYLDLLSFHQSVVKMLLGDGWKRMFESRWRDYQGNLQTTFMNFETNSQVTRVLSDAWKQQRVAEIWGRVDGHIGQSESSAGCVQRLVDFTPIFDEITRRHNEFLSKMSELGQNSKKPVSQYYHEASTHAETWKAIHKQLNDHVIRSADGPAVLNSLFKMFNDHRKNMDSQFKYWEAERNEKQKTDVLKWMSPSSPDISQKSRHDDLCSMRAPGTCLWILKNRKLSSWMNEENPIACLLWINGKMGAGKSVLTSQIVETCREQVEGFEVSYYYCCETDAQNSSLAVLRGILRQMAERDVDNNRISYCNSKRIDGRQEFLDQIKVVKDLIEALCESGPHQFVIIDGLDECKRGDLKEIVDFWKSLVGKIDMHSPGKLRLLFVSQDSADIRDTLRSSLSAAVLDLDTAKTNQDIRIYLEGKGRDIQAKFTLDDSQIQTLLDMICKRAEGMFLYAFLTVDNLLQQPTKFFFQKELDRNLPANLAEAYGNVIKRLKRDSARNVWTETRNTLRWLAGAMRPLKWRELQAALAIRLDSRGPSFDYDSHRLRTDIRDICGALVRVVQQPDDDMRLVFTHATTREYIRSEMHHEDLDAVAIDCDLASKCLSYLSMDCFQPNLNERQRQEYAQMGYYALQDYAASQWGRHMEQFISHAAPMFERGSSDAAHAAQQLTMALQRFLGFYREIAQAQRGLGIPSQGDWALPIHSSSHSGRLSAGPSVPFSQNPIFSNDRAQNGRLCPALATSRPSSSMSSSPASSAPPDPAGSAVKLCEPFRSIPGVYNPILQLWTHVRSHQVHMDPKIRESLSIQQLRIALERTRKTIQLLSPEDQVGLPEGTFIRTLYGTRLYKCDRVLCDYFFEGFATAAELKDHLGRHERPYRCPVPNCSVGPLGFSKKKDCESHIRKYHPEADDGQHAFASGSSKAPAEDIEARAKYKCTFEGCSKKYTRKANLDAHLDTHNGTRRYSCRTCVKAFTRPSDRQRHEKLHIRK